MANLPPVSRIDKVTVHVDSTQTLNVAVLIPRDHISIKTFVETYDAYFVYTDEDGIHRIALPGRDDRPAYNGDFWRPGTFTGVFGFQSLHHKPPIATGSRSKDVRDLIDHYTFVGILDCKELMDTLFLAPTKESVKKWIKVPSNVASTYFLTVKAAPVNAVDRFIEKHNASFLKEDFSFDSLFNLFDVYQVFFSSFSLFFFFIFFLSGKPRPASSRFSTNAP